MLHETLTWLGIAFCLTQSAAFSGLNLAVFSLSRLRLEAAAESGDGDAQRVLALRRDANFVLATILLGNVAINVFPVFPPFQRSAEDAFLRQLEASGKKWIVITDLAGEPRFVMDAHAFLRGALFADEQFDPRGPCHRPLIVRDSQQPLGQVLGRLTVCPDRPGDDVIDEDLILVWTPADKRIITGADILGRLLRGIARVSDAGPGRVLGGEKPAAQSGGTSAPCPE